MNQYDLLTKMIIYKSIVRQNITRLYERLFGFCFYPFDVSIDNPEAAVRAYFELDGAYV